MPISITTPPTWYRLIRFIANEDGKEYLGEPVDPDMDIGLAYHDSTPILAHILDTLKPWDPHARRTGAIFTVKILLSPISSSQVGTIRATGLSYRDHAAEMNLAYPSVPALFFKPSTCLANPGEDIPIPKVCQREEMDYEVELAVVIGKECKDVKEEDALHCVLGWTGANDLTARKHQAESSQWGYAKGE
nr:uncharacterized protein CI109_005272 [Kwoniella shandongensis]KAA5526316.1 hypothetical protein CI109_005272 [Kwoniella shandongensis]